MYPCTLSCPALVKELKREREKKSKLIFSSRLDGVFCRLTSACTMYSNNDRYPHTDTGVPPSTLLAQLVALSFFFSLHLGVSSLLELLTGSLVGWYVCVCVNQPCSWRR